MVQHRLCVGSREQRDVVNVGPGTYTEALVVTNSVSLIGPHATTTIVQAAATPGIASTRVIDVMSNAVAVTLSGLTLRHGNAETGRGAGIRADADLIPEDCIVTRNSTTWGGGGLYVSRGSTTVDRCEFSHNSAVGWGGGVLSSLGEQSTFRDSTISHNSADEGGAYQGLFYDCIISNNSARFGGGVRLSTFGRVYFGSK